MSQILCRSKSPPYFCSSFFSDAKKENSRQIVQVILEWTLSFGGITVVMSYCISEIVKQKQQNLTKTYSVARMAVV